MIGRIKYLWGCDRSNEKDIFDSCQVLSQHESEIVNDLDQKFSFLSARHFDQRFASQIKIDNTYYKVPTGPGKPGKSWNFIMAFSRTGKSWKNATGPGKFWKSVKLG